MCWVSISSINDNSFLWKSQICLKKCGESPPYTETVCLGIISPMWCAEHRPHQFKGTVRIGVDHLPGPWMRILLVPEVWHRGRHMKIKSQQKQTLVYIMSRVSSKSSNIFSLQSVPSKTQREQYPLSKIRMKWRSGWKSVVDSWISWCYGRSYCVSCNSC